MEGKAKSEKHDDDPWGGVYAVLGKRIRNKRKKLDKMKGVENDAKSGKITLTKEQEDMLAGKEGLVA